MYQTPEQLIALNKANLETALRFAGVALDGAERLIDLQMKTAKTALADSIQTAQAIADGQGPGAVRRAEGHRRRSPRSKKPPPTRRTSTTSRRDPGRIQQARRRAGLRVQQAGRLGARPDGQDRPGGFRSRHRRHEVRLAAVNSGFDNLTKVAKQFGEATQNNIEVVANQTIEGAKKAKKKA